MEIRDNKGSTPSWKGQVEFFAVGWDDSMPNSRRKTFDVSATLFRTEAEALAYQKGTVLSVRSFWAKSEAEVDLVIAAHRQLVNNHLANLAHLRD